MSQINRQSFKARLVESNRDDRANSKNSDLFNSENRPIHGHIMTFLDLFERFSGENRPNLTTNEEQFDLAFKDFRGLIKVHERLSLEIASGVPLTSENIHRYEKHIDDVLSKLLPIFQLSDPKEENTKNIESNLRNFLYYDIVIKDKANQETKDQFIVRVRNDILHGVSAYSNSKIGRESIVTKIFSEVSDVLSGYVGFYDTEAEKDPKVTVDRTPKETSKSQFDRDDAAKRETYENRPIGESAPDFIKRVYGHKLTGEFTRANLRNIDPQAEMALRNWERSNGRASLNLPTKKERNDALLKRDPETLSEYERQAQKRIELSRKHHPIRR